MSGEGWGLRLKGDWERVAKLMPGLGPRVKEATGKAILQEAHFLRKKVLQAFQDGGHPGAPWKEHSPWTRAVRLLLGNKKSKLLIQSSDLRNAVAVVPIPGGGAFVGIRRAARSSYPGGVVNLAELHEFGKEFDVTMTDKMRKLLFAAANRAGMERKAPRGPRRPGGAPIVVHIRIPARPILGPVFDRFAKPADLELSIVSRVALMLGGDIGKPPGTPRE